MYVFIYNEINLKPVKVVFTKFERLLNTSMKLKNKFEVRNKRLEWSF